MKKYLTLTGLCIFLVHSSLMGASPVQSQEQQTYQQALYHQILLQEERAAIYLTKMQGNPSFSGKFREAEKMLEVKQVLFKNFSESPALGSPTVRTQLLQLMSKEKIEAKELVALQETVNKELHRSK